MEYNQLNHIAFAHCLYRHKSEYIAHYIVQHRQHYSNSPWTTLCAASSALEEVGLVALPLLDGMQASSRSLSTSCNRSMTFCCDMMLLMLHTRSDACICSLYKRNNSAHKLHDCCLLVEKICCICRTDSTDMQNVVFLFSFLFFTCVCKKPFYLQNTLYFLFFFFEKRCLVFAKHIVFV